MGHYGESSLSRLPVNGVTVEKEARYFRHHPAAVFPGPRHREGARSCSTQSENGRDQPEVGPSDGEERRGLSPHSLQLANQSMPQERECDLHSRAR